MDDCYIFILKIYVYLKHFLFIKGSFLNPSSYDYYNDDSFIERMKQTDLFKALKEFANPSISVSALYSTI